MRVLVAEDNLINQIVIQRMLEKLGHAVEIVTDGEAALEKLESFVYDLLITDVNMPGIDGIQMTRFIRNLDHPNARINIVALTASATERDRDICLNAGMNDFLAKPVDVRALRLIIERCSAGLRSTTVHEGGIQQQTYCRRSTVNMAGTLVSAN